MTDAQMLSMLKDARQRVIPQQVGNTPNLKIVRADLDACIEELESRDRQRGQIAVLKTAERTRLKA